MPNISFQQVYALVKGCFISPVGNTKFKLTDETGQDVDLKTIVSGNLINLSTVPSLAQDGTLNPPNQSYNLADSDDLSISSGLIYKEGGSFDSNVSVSDTEKLYHFTGQKILKKLK